MSWKIINEILYLAVIDKDFAEALLDNAIEAVTINGFSLTHDEEKIFRSIHAKDLSSFSKQLIEHIASEE